MAEEKNHEAEKPTPIAWFRALSGFLASVALAGAALVGTNWYNDRQLEIARNRELSQLVPQLGDSLASRRKFTAISLALYGKYAISPLMAALGDEDPDVRDASARSLSLIGSAAAPTLDSAFLDTRNSPRLRGSAIRALAMMRDTSVYHLMTLTLRNDSEPSEVREWAAYAIGLAKDKRGGPFLVKTLESERSWPGGTKSYAIYALRDINYAPAEPVLTAILRDPTESAENRIAAAWALAHIASNPAISSLNEASRSAQPDTVRRTAAEALSWARDEGKLAAQPSPPGN